MTRVAPADRLWLDLERTDNPITITGVIEFSGKVEEGAVRALLRERLLAPHPRFASRVVRTGTGWRWERVGALDLDAHVHRIGLPAPGDDAALHRVVGQLMSQRLDLDRPLWQIHLVDRGDGRTALVARLHHAIADGISLARVLLSLADLAGGDAWSGRGPRRALGARIAELASRATDPVAVRRALGFGGRSARAVADLAALDPDPDTPLKGPLSPVKRVSWTDAWAVDEVKAVARSCGATINDVLLATLAGALRRHLHAAGAFAPDLRTFVPVNLRPLDAPLPRDLGNRFGLVVVPLPVGEPDPRVQLRTVKARMDAMKRSPEPLVTYAALQGLGAAPDAVTRAGVAHFGRRASAITTNVPGPRVPMTLAGVPVTGMMFWVPQSAGVGLGISIFSYAGRVRVGVAADALRVADPAGVVAHWHDAFEALRDAAR